MKRLLEYHGDGRYVSSYPSFPVGVDRVDDEQSWLTAELTCADGWLPADIDLAARRPADAARESPRRGRVDIPAGFPKPCFMLDLFA